MITPYLIPNFFPSSFEMDLIFSSAFMHQSLPPGVLKLQPSHTSRPYSPLACLKSSKLETEVLHRRSANYHPTVWENEFIQSLQTPYTYERFSSCLEELKQEAKRLLRTTKEPVRRLELIDQCQRLGVAYHFDEEIKEALELTYSENDDLYTTSLHFRLKRQHDCLVTSDVFNKFRTGDGRFKEYLIQDVKGLLSLYEASFLSIDGEDVLEEAGKFTHESLKSLMEHNHLTKEVQLSIEIPVLWRMPRIDCRNYINAYERNGGKNLVLLELAKLDFNLVQSVHQGDLIDLSRWWKQLGFSGILSFSRDRLVENFIWSTGISFEPQFSKCRINLTKFICILSAIDDMYDIYGSLEELELFTEAVNRWDITANENLPDYMKDCYSAMFSFADDIAYEIQSKQGIDVLPYIKKEWGSLCRSYLVEARWFYNGYKPTLAEYLGNSWTSVGGPSAMLHAYILHGETITVESLDCLKNGSELVYWASVITRLNDDLGTSKDEMERGDVPKSIQCYMNEMGVFEEEAREYIRGLVSSSWKKLNEEGAKSFLPKSFVNMVVNMARTSQSIFEHGDGIGTSDGMTKDRVMSLFIEPIPIKLTTNCVNE